MKGINNAQHVRSFFANYNKSTQYKIESLNHVYTFTGGSREEIAPPFTPNRIDTRYTRADATVIITHAQKNCELIHNGRVVIYFGITESC